MTSKILQKEHHPEKHSLFLFLLPQSYSTRVNEVNQIHVHKLLCAPIQTQISVRLQREFNDKLVWNQLKNCLKSTEKMFQMSQNNVWNQSKNSLISTALKTDSLTALQKERHVLTDFHGRKIKDENEKNQPFFSMVQKTKTIFDILNDIFAITMIL